MTQPFTRRSAVAPRAWHQRLLAVARPDAAADRIANLFATRDPADVSPAELMQILEEEAIRGQAARRQVLDVYEHALRALLTDTELSADELAYLERLRRALLLSAEDAAAVREHLSGDTFSQMIEAALSDGTLTDQERAHIVVAAERMGLSDDVASARYVRHAHTFLSAKLQEYLADGRYSPIEENRLRKLAESFGVTLEYDATTTRAIERARLMWEVENGQLPDFTPRIQLHRGERCHLAMPASWHEMRTKTARVDYHGISTRIRIARGVYYRAGTIQARPVKYDELTKLDDGTVYVTSKRIIFDGAAVNKTVGFGSLLGIEVFSDAVALEKSTGKSPYIFPQGDVELFATVLGAALALA